MLFVQRDDEFDMSYEGLLSLSTLLGDVKPRGTPADIISSLPKGTYGEWKTPGETEERCPICLDDVSGDGCVYPRQAKRFAYSIAVHGN